jgi:acyl-CoA synthetase (NDP forming)
MDAMIDPRSVVVIGAGADPASPGGAMYRRLRDLPIPVWPVHPTRKSIDGERCYPDVTSLPGVPELAVIATRAGHVPAALEECSHAGIAAAISIAGGFSETGESGREIEERLRAILARGPTRLLGPNTLGVVAPHTGLDTIFVRHEESVFLEPGELSFVTQSGSVGVEALARFGAGIRLFIGLGNQLDIDVSDVLDYLRHDEGTRVTALYIESIPDGRALARSVSDHASSGRPVVVLAVGRSARGSRAAASHTGRLAGPAAITDGALVQAGALLARDDEHLLDLARALSFCPPARGRSMAVVSAAGGYAVLGTDIVLEDGSLSLADLTDGTRSRVARACPPYGSANNPVDMTGMATDAMYAEVLGTLVEAPEVDGLVCFLSWGPHGLTDRCMEVIERASRVKPLVVHAMAGPGTDRLVDDLVSRRVAAYPSMRRAVQAMRGLVRWGLAQDRAALERS